MAVEAKKTSLDIATDQKYVYVLFSGTESGAGRIIDVYDKMNGEYVQSIKLDREAYRMGISDDWLYLLFYDESSKSYKVARHELPAIK